MLSTYNVQVPRRRTRRRNSASSAEPTKLPWSLLLPLLLLSFHLPSSTEAWSSSLSLRLGRSSPLSRHRSTPISITSVLLFSTRSGGQQQQQRGNAISASTARNRTKPKKKPPPPQSNNNNSSSDNKPKSLGEAVQQAETVEELLEVAAQFWLPSDPDLKPHLKAQSIHHEKRQRWAAQWLSKFGDVCLTTTLLNFESNLGVLCQDQRLGRAVLAAAIPYVKIDATTDTDNNQNIKSNDKERRLVREALLGLHTLVGHITSTTKANNKSDDAVHEDIASGVQLLLERAEAMANEFSLQDAIEVRWAARGLEVRLNSILDRAIKKEEQTETIHLTSTFEKLDCRAAELPFDILPMGFDISSPDLVNDESGLDHTDEDAATTMVANNQNVMAGLQESIPFNYDTIVTRQGTGVVERRATAWVAEEGIGALAYSGKLMKPSPMPDLVRSIMRQVETAIDAPSKDFFDCALCNYYPDGETSCRFHTDPEHGTMWERLNVVVSAGNPRRFAFRPIPEVTTWGEWDGGGGKDDNNNTNNNNLPTGTKDDTTNAPVVIRFFPGDIVQMWGTCNDDFYHAVYPESCVPAVLPHQQQQTNAVDVSRVSLVLKRAMVNGSGSKQRRGHSNAGEGRRSRRNRASQ